MARASGSSQSTNARRLTWAAVALWIALVPAACALTGAVVIGQGARTAATRTAVAHSFSTLTAASVATPVAAVGPATAPASPGPLPAAATSTITPCATRTASATPSQTHTRVPSPTRTATTDATASPVELVIGESVAGRPLTVTQFGSGPVVRLIVAGIHGGSEWNTIALADELSAHLTEHPERVPADVTLYLLRALNPDGAARGTDIYARANDNNVDLNRNWPSRWQADWSRNGCWRHLRLSGGSHAGSEPETQALMQFILTYEVDAVISYHSAALGIFAGGQPPDPASLSLADAVADVSDYPYPPLDFGCIYGGQLIDWASEQGIAALDIELTNHHDTDFEQNLRILNVFLTWRR